MCARASDAPQFFGRLTINISQSPAEKAAAEERSLIQRKSLAVRVIVCFETDFADPENRPVGHACQVDCSIIRTHENVQSCKYPGAESHLCLSQSWYAIPHDIAHHCSPLRVVGRLCTTAAVLTERPWLPTLGCVASNPPTRMRLVRHSQVQVGVVVV